MNQKLTNKQADGGGDVSEPTKAYARCPGCQTQLKLPFYLHARTVWLPYVHVRRGGNCRVLLGVHPNGTVSGYVLPRDLAFEDAPVHFKIRLREQ